MELSDLTAYAKEKFHIQEQHKWADFPGFSVLTDPKTGKWVALLMRQWDFDTGTEIQRCDIKCGQRTLSEISESYLSLPFRMRGQKWVGVAFNDSTEPDVVFRLFDRAVYAGEQHGYTIVLKIPSTKPMVVYPDTALPTTKTQWRAFDPNIPERIRGMLLLYEYKDGSFAQKCRNFYRQGKFMENYEDDAPWAGMYRRYFPTYHDLNIQQLRGYFTWRTRVRRGDFSPIATSLAYLYLYELLNGIGTSSPEDTLKKMQEFEVGFLNSGIGDSGMRGNLHRWMLEYAVIHNVSPAIACRYVDLALIKRDAALAVLRDPQESSDEEIFSALCIFAGKKLEQSPVVTKDQEKGKHLFAAVWRHASETYASEDKNFFTACFGEQKTFLWHPLGNAIYWEEDKHSDADYVLDECRSYHCRSGVWRVERYDNLYFDWTRFHSLLHESDRVLRRYLKTGHYLRENPDEAWATSYAEGVIQSEHAAELEAARPKITINFSSLEQIRQDALITRDSLLTEAEMDMASDPGQEKQPEEPAHLIHQDETESTDSVLAAMDTPYRQILFALLRGEPIKTYIKANRLMPSVVADTINEALFDEIGDNVLEYDGDTITVVEDYRDDVLQVFGGRKQ